MKFLCGNWLAEIKTIDKNGVDWSLDMYNAGSLPYDGDLEAYRVDDMEEVIEYARDWEAARGDFEGDDADDGRRVEIEDLEFPPVSKVDGCYILPGDWLRNTTGIYVVQEIYKGRVYAKEIIWEDDCSDNFHLAEDKSIFTFGEAERMDR